MSFFNIYLSMTPQISVKNQKMNNKSEGRGTFVILNVDNSHTSVLELRNLLKIERGKAKDCNVMKAYTWIL